MMVDLSYADVERTLAAMHRIADDKRIAFKARLKHFQRLGFPAGSNTGTGRRASYDADMLLQLCMAVELTQCGMPPKFIVQILKDNWSETRHAFLYAMSSDEVFSHLLPIFKSPDLAWIIQPEAMRDLSTEGVGEYDFKEAVSIRTMNDVSSYFVEQRQYGIVVGDAHRHTVIHLRQLAGRLVHELTKAVSNDDIGKDMLIDIYNQVEIYQQRQREAFAALDHLIGVRDADDSQA